MGGRANADKISKQAVNPFVGTGVYCDWASRISVSGLSVRLKC